MTIYCRMAGLSDFTVETAHQMTPADTYLDEIRSAGHESDRMYGDYDRSAYTPGFTLFDLHGNCLIY